jgi:hypothetical protein
MVGTRIRQQALTTHYLQITDNGAIVNQEIFTSTFELFSESQGKIIKSYFIP